jgi:FixJ family two-component response regulator
MSVKVRLEHAHAIELAEKYGPPVTRRLSFYRHDEAYLVVPDRSEADCLVLDLRMAVSDEDTTLHQRFVRLPKLRVMPWGS